MFFSAAERVHTAKAGAEAERGALRGAATRAGAGGGKGGPNKELVLVAAEVDGRVRLAHAETNVRRRSGASPTGRSRPTRGSSRTGWPATMATAWVRGPTRGSFRPRPSGAKGDALQVCHWTISLLKRWLLGTHAGAVGSKHLQAYLDEFAFRHNRRRTKVSAGSRRASSSGSWRAAADHAFADRRHTPLPLVSVTCANGIGYGLCRSDTLHSVVARRRLRIQR